MQAKTEHDLKFDDRLERIRLNKRISKGELAAQLGVSRTMLHYIKKGIHPPSAEVLERLEAEEHAAGLLNAAQRAAFQQKTLHEFTEADWRILVENYPEEARELQQSIAQIEEAGKILTALRAEVQGKLMHLRAQFTALFTPPPKK